MQRLTGALLVCFTLMACPSPTAAAGRGLLQTYPTCGTGEQEVILDTLQLAFNNLTTGSLAFDCDKLYEGYSRGCVSNSVYTYISEEIAPPPYLPGQVSPRPFVSAYAKPADIALEVKQALYYLDLQTGSIFVSPPAADFPPEVQYPQFQEYNPRFDATGSAAGYPDNGGFPEYSSCDINAGDSPNHTNKYGDCALLKYTYYLNEIRSAVQNVTSAPQGEAAFACNPAVPGLSPLLEFLNQVQGIAGNRILPLSPILVTGPLPAGEIPQGTRTSPL